jgi:N-acetylglutamate synthase
VRTVEQAAFDLALQQAWPSRETVAIGPWTARLDDGVTRRANSVLTHGHGTDSDEPGLDHLLTRSLEVYARHGLTPWLQLTGATWPPRLRERLAARGWETGIDRTLLLAGPLAPPGPTEGVSLANHASDEWLATWCAVEPRRAARERAVVAALLARLEHAAFAQVTAAGTVVGTALGVLVEETLVLECIATTAAARRRRVATRAIAAVAEWASERGARRTLLAVQERNVAARQLYETLGLAPAGWYAYARPAMGAR